MKTHNHTYYWESWKEADQYARDNGYPRERIFHFGLGYAIQLWVSGPYVGPHTRVYEWDEQKQA